jgi:hypothetical protein
MTIPWMMNCPHSGEGWCLECATKLGEERNELNRIVSQLPLTADGVRIVPGMKLWIFDTNLDDFVTSWHAWEFHQRADGRWAISTTVQTYDADQFFSTEEAAMANSKST